MATNYRDIEILAADYAAALTEGTVSEFFASLTREEAKAITSSRSFSQVAVLSQRLFQHSYGVNAATPHVHDFLWRLDAEIKARMNRARGDNATRKSVRPDRKSASGRTGRKA